MDQVDGVLAHELTQLAPDPREAGGLDLDDVLAAQDVDVEAADARLDTIAAPREAALQLRVQVMLVECADG
jgi:hypothetical protein